MIKVNLRYEWTPTPGQGHALEPTLFRILHGVDASGSLAETARRLGMSYRHVWGLTGKWEQTFGRPVVELRQGRGAQLTEFGRKLLWSEELVQARISQELENVRREIEHALASDTPGARLAICASHDLALAGLRDRLAHRDGLKLDLRFKGSLESLCALAKNRCAMAGFHLAEGMVGPAAESFLRYLKPRVHTLVGIATRTQGLMVGTGNPKRISNLADLMRKDVRIVNRQAGSGSRVEFDELLSGAGIDAHTIEGYANEEFTHLAVAATVAGGRADVGYGIRAAAAEYGLDFVPLLTERYFLACRNELLEEPSIAELIRLLQGEEFRQILAGLPGYGSAITGLTYPVGDVLPKPHARKTGSGPSAQSKRMRRAVA